MSEIVNSLRQQETVSRNELRSLYANKKDEEVRFLIAYTSYEIKQEVISAAEAGKKWYSYDVCHFDRSLADEIINGLVNELKKIFPDCNISISTIDIHIRWD